VFSKLSNISSVAEVTRVKRILVFKPEVDVKELLFSSRSYSIEVVFTFDNC
jgi:hypothetical protein